MKRPLLAVAVAIALSLLLKFAYHQHRILKFRRSVDACDATWQACRERSGHPVLDPEDESAEDNSPCGVTWWACYSAACAELNGGAK